MTACMRKRHYTGFWRQRAIIHLLSVMGSILPLTGCNDSGNPQTTPVGATSSQTQSSGLSLSQLAVRVSERFKGASGSVPEAFGPRSDELQKMTIDEMEKVFKWEYRVIDLPNPVESQNLEKKLSELGSEGWECFSISSERSATRVTCKRRPRGALAYLKLIPGL